MNREAELDLITSFIALHSDDFDDLIQLFEYLKISRTRENLRQIYVKLSSLRADTGDTLYHK